MSEKFVTRCPYCGGIEFGIGYQSGHAAITTSLIGFSSSKVIHQICKGCGSIVHSRVDKPYKFNKECV